MTYQQIEAAFEQKTNSLDAQYMSKAIGEIEYKTKLRALDRWFEAKAAHAA